MRTIRIISVGLLTLVSYMSYAQGDQRSFSAKPIEDNTLPEIDGKLNEDVWQDTPESWGSDFTQRLPNEGKEATEQTHFKILYDAKFLYVGVRCDESVVSKVNQRMSRRDGYNGDWVEIILDTYHDKRTAFSFTLSAAGVKSDKYITLNGTEEDIAWNPIWYARSIVTATGWTAEMKIPLSQLRFSREENQVWGLQVQRRILRNEELSVWKRVPQDAPGWVSEFGLLTGIASIKPQRQLEIQPFMVGAMNTFEKAPQNPFRDANELSTKFGIDGKIGITNDVTLDVTINPDFGQVEADPAAIALDGFQLFFQEQRPFFIENKNLFDYRLSVPIIGSSYSSDNLFYSRRIGRMPQGSVSVNENEYVNRPQQTTILGAVKLSGKTKQGLSFGILESITSQENAQISTGQSQIIEPSTNYLVARVLQDLNSNKTFVGGMFTSVDRASHDETNFLHKSARTGGIDLLHQWQDRNWYFGSNFVVSHVTGSPEAILKTQQSIPHLFQRQASHITVDSTKTSLTGTGGDIKIGKAGKGHIQAEAGVTWRSPELELNDVGFMRESDIIQQYSGLSYRSVNSFAGFRSAQVSYQHWFDWDFEGKLNYIDWDLSVDAVFQNNWSMTLGYFSQPHTYSKSLLQGGPRIRLSDQYGFWWALNMDSRKKFFATYSGWTKTGGTGSYYLLENRIDLNYQPLDRFRFSVGSRYLLVNHRLQYNEKIALNAEDHYLVSMLDQNTLSFTLRADVVINPNMAVQYYAEPFISSGKYQGFGVVVNPLDQFGERQLQQVNVIDSEQGKTGSYELDVNGDGEIDTTISNPDFSYAQFRSNLVYRWEYRPGSELFIVWSQGLTNSALPEERLVSSFREQVFSKTLNNTFLVKLTYRFHR